MPSAPSPSGLQVVVPYGPAGSSARVRGFDWLNATGLKAVVHDYLGLPVNAPGLVLGRPVDAARAEAGLRALARHVSHDTVYLVREASPFSRGRIEAALLSRAHRGVYDFDDALHVPADGLVERIFSKAAKWRRAVAAADVVIAGNQILAEAADSAGHPDVRLIPSCVDPGQYRLKQDFARGAVPRALWLGSPATEGYLAAVASPLLAAHRSHGLRLTVISAGERSLGALDSMVDRIAWTPQAGEQLADADFGIMPLPDDPWTRGKCAYKLLQYGAAGLPMIGSPVGANQGALRSMGGLSAATDAEWEAALESLMTASEADLAAAGRTARAGVEADFSFAAWAPEWLEAVGAHA